MEYVFVKDSEGYVFKKEKSKVTSDEIIISEDEYLEISGLQNGGVYGNTKCSN